MFNCPRSSLCNGGGHNLNRFTSYPIIRKFSSQKEEISKGEIVIKDDVWIGRNVTILSGVTIGQGAVIGACSVVAKDIPPYSIVVGNPARVIKYRFSEDIIAELLKIDYDKIVKKDKSVLIKLYRMQILEDNVKDIVQILNG